VDEVDRRDTVPVEVGQLYSLPISVVDRDECDQPVVSLERVRPLPAGPIELLSSGDNFVLNFRPNPEDSGKFFMVMLSVSDGYARNHFKFSFQVVAGEDQPEEVFTSLGLTITSLHDQVPGEIAELDLLLDSISQAQSVGGFDLQIGFDSLALSIAEVLPGNLYDSCAWEYFTYQNSSGLVHIVGIAETNNGAAHPSCGAPASLPVSLARLRFLVGSDSSWSCKFAPVRFYWNDCGDNAVSSATGQHLFGAEKVFELQDSIYVELPANGAVLPGFGGLPSSGCDAPIRKIVCYTGGIGIACPAPVADARGDVNLNSLPFEMEDFRLFGRYFVSGSSVFTVDPDGQSAASDINEDGTLLAVEDYVLTYRRVVGLDSSDVLPPASPNTAAFFIASGMLLAATSDTLGAVSFVLQGNVAPQLVATTMSMQTSYRNGSTYVLLSPKENFPNATFFRAGPLLRILTTTAIQSVAAATKHGGKVTTQIGQTVANAALSEGLLPGSYDLHQNYPNPFNGATIIGFDLPHGDNVTLEIINVLGKVVYRRNESLSAGSHQFSWDGSASDGNDVASGVYYYRLSSGSFAATKKMMLLK
jgi:hypothetical protein